MKKLLLSLSVLLSIGAAAQNPILTQANHAPEPGSSYISLDCDTTNTQSLLQTNAANTGSLALWNFTSLSVNTTTNAFTVSTYTGSTYAPANVFVASTNDTYSESNIAYLKLIAAEANINGVNATLTYTAPATLATYPMTYSANVSSSTAGNINPTGTFVGNCDVKYDAVGSLMLPSRTFTNVTRVNTIQSYTYNSPGFFNGFVTTNTYDYYAISLSRIPLLSITTTTVNHNQLFPVASTTNDQYKFITVLKDYNLVSVDEISQNKIDLITFPNPANNQVTFTTKSKEAIKVVIMDVTGKVMTTEQFEMGNAKLNVSNYSAGMYLYNVLNKNNEVLARDKFNVAK